MNNKEKDDIFYVCTLLEYIARKTNNTRKNIISYFNKKDVERQLRLAEINHCLSFEQVSDELIENYGIKKGTEENKYKYAVPSEQAIGRVYQMLISSVSGADDVAETLIKVFASFISDEISDFNSSVYYSNPDYIRCSYLEGKLLA